MNRLPPELWARVCNLSDVRSLKTIRLVNSTLTQIAACYLFQRLSVTLIPKYLNKAAELAFHPTLRFHVRTLYFNYGILNEKFAEYETWKGAIGLIDSSSGEESGPEDRFIRLSEVEICSQAVLDRYHTNFCRLFTSQKACFDSRMDLAMLSAAFAMLPNLRTIKSLEAESCSGAFPRLSDLQSETYLQVPFVDPSESTQSGLSRPLASLLSGLGLTRKQIITMEIGEIAWSFWEDNGPSGFLLDAERFIHAAFQHLESITVHFLVDIDDLLDRLQGLLPLSITRFVGAAPKLRLLDLSFQCYGANNNQVDFHGWPEAFCPVAGQLFATLTLPNLAIFRLECCILTEQILQDFITRHAATLKEISMAGVVLVNTSEESTSWEKTLKRIAPIMFLDSVNLRGLSSDDIESVVRRRDTDFGARIECLFAYCQALTIFLLQRGRTECPRIADFARP